jgi:hypothetical protein
MSEKHEPNLQTETAEKKVDDLGAPIKKETKQSQNQGRRKFIKGAAAATPIVLSVASRPVWARNCSLSGQLSGNLSDDGIPCVGEGCTTDFWSQSINLNFYHPKFPPNMLFSEAFGRNAFPGKTLFQVIQKNVANNEVAVPFGCTPTSDCRNALLELGAQAVAALQNSTSPVKYDLEVGTVILSFQNSFDTGTALAFNDTLTAFQKFNNQFCPLA